MTKTTNSALCVLLLTLAAAITLIFGVNGYAYEIDENGGEYDGYIVKFKQYEPDLTATNSNSDINVWGELVPNHYIYTLKNPTEEYIDYLEASGKTEYICKNYIIENETPEPETGLDAFPTPGESATLSDDLPEPNDPYYASRQWNLRMINAAYAWATGATGEGVRVGVIDSGVESTHDDLSAHVTTGYNVINNSYDTEPDGNRHGTFVSGIIAAETNNGIGIAGCSDATIVPIKAFSGSKTSLSYITRSIYVAVDDLDCEVLNLSFTIAYNESSANQTAMREAVDYATSKDVICVAAAGNQNSSQINAPACFDNVIGVGSLTSSGVRASTSNYNYTVDVTAPGVDVFSSTLNNSYTTGSGTSYAAPHVAAAAAIAKSIDPYITPAEFNLVLEACSDDLGDTGYDVEYGWGCLNIQKIIDFMSGGEFGIAGSSVAIDPGTPSSANVELTLNNTLYKDVNAAVYLAAFDQNGALYSLVCDETLIGSNTETILSETLELPDGGGVIKTYVWDKNQRPLTDVYDIYQSDGAQTDGAQTDDSQTGGSQTDDGQTDDGQTGGSQTDSSQTDVNQTDNGQTGDGQTDGNQTDDSQTGNSQTDTYQTDGAA